MLQKGMLCEVSKHKPRIQLKVHALRLLATHAAVIHISQSQGVSYVWPMYIA